MRRAAPVRQRSAAAAAAMIAPARAPRLRLRQRQPQAARTAGLLRFAPVALAAAEVVAVGIVVAARAGGPHEPDDERADVEDPQTPHEDPTLHGHSRKPKPGA